MCSLENLSSALANAPVADLLQGTHPIPCTARMKAGQQLSISSQENTAHHLLMQGGAWGSSTHQEFLSFQQNL